MPDLLPQVRRCCLLVLIAGVSPLASAQDTRTDTLAPPPPPAAPQSLPFIVSFLDSCIGCHLGEVVVTALNPTLAAQENPYARAATERTDMQMATATGDFGETLVGLPGVWVSDRGSYAQGPRLLVRGMGWRSAFGVRGTHVLLDGVPLTLPDGQTQLDVIDPALVKRAEIVRGPASAFVGSGSGGVLALSTVRPLRDEPTTSAVLDDRGLVSLPSPPDAPQVQARLMAGGYGRRGVSLAMRPRIGRGDLAVWGSALHDDGYRPHSEARLYRFGATATRRLRWNLRTTVTALLLHMPRAESPGGITFEAARANPRQVREAAIAQDASKAVTQGYVSAHFVYDTGYGDLTATARGSFRRLDNPIVPRYIQLDREAGGLRVTFDPEVYHFLPPQLSLSIGAEIDVQRDVRIETNNLAGETGPLVLTDQVEMVRSGAVFGYAQYAASSATTVTGAVRGDLLQYSADPADASRTARTLGAVSPSLGISMQFGTGYEGRAYANIAGALDAPTTTELGNRQSDASGFDRDLEAERTWSVEAGTRLQLWRPRTGRFALPKIAFDFAVFRATVSDLIVPFEVDDITFYRNAGRTRHLGFEAAVQVSPAPIWSSTPMLRGYVSGSLAYTWVHARFQESAGALVVAGNAVPGIPAHVLTGSLRWTTLQQYVLGFEGEAVSGYPADSQNAASTHAYALVHLRIASALALRRIRSRITPFAAIRNVFDVRYTSSVVVNGFGGRYAEPGAGRHVIAGVTVDVR